MGQYEGTIMRLPDGSICLWGRKHLVSYHINVGFTVGTGGARTHDYDTLVRCEKLNRGQLRDATIKLLRIVYRDEPRIPPDQVQSGCSLRSK